MTLTSGKIQNTHPHPEALDIFSLERDVTSFTFRFDSAEEKWEGALILVNLAKLYLHEQH